MAELRPYNPSWRDRVAVGLLNAGMPRSSVVGLMGSAGLGEEGPLMGGGLLDLTPAGIPFWMNEAARTAGTPEGTLRAMALVPGAKPLGEALGKGAARVASHIPWDEFTPRRMRPRPARTSTLPMDDASRASRAVEQGYTIDAFKGAHPIDGKTLPVHTTKHGKKYVLADTADNVPEEIASFASPGKLEKGGRFAGFFGDKATANRFAEAYSHVGGGGVYPAKIKMENPVVIDAKGKRAAAFQWESIAKESNTLDDYHRFQDAFLDGSSHDGAILKNTTDEGTVYVPRAPSQARSKWAEFNPKRQGASDMMASVVAILGGGAAGYGLLGNQPQAQAAPGLMGARTGGGF